MIIKNGEVFQEDGSFRLQDLYVENHRIVASEDEVTDKTIVDAAGLRVLPGLVDIHSHGAFGHDFSDADPEGLKIILKYEKSHGITSYCPTSMTLPAEELKEIFATIKTVGEMKDGAAVRGINMEGPFISMAKKGAQNGKYIHKPDVAMFERLQEAAGGLFKLVDLAPEEEGAMEFIRAEKGKVVLSIAHTTADYETAKAAIEAGVTHMTHLYNAMNPINHRAPGPIIAAADDAHCEAELICDNVHIHPAIVRNTFKMFGEDRVIFISDTMEAAGLEDGMYELGGQPVIVKGNRATLEDGTIAGSNTNLMKCMRTAVKQMGIPLEKAVKCAAVNPAKSIGIYDKYGSITPGKVANAVLLDRETLEIKGVILKGQML